MEMTYRTRRKLQRAGVIALVVLLILVMVWACWLVWVKRHIVFGRDGAVLDFDLAGRDYGEGELAVPPTDGETVSIYYNDGSEFAEADSSMRWITGYYITTEMLQNDMDTIRATIAALPVGCGVMMEVKSIRGSYYYSTGIPDTYSASGMDVEAVDALIADIASRNLYFIASVPAFRDRNFGAENVSAGLPFVGGNGALWVDSSKCYWLDPTKRDTLNYLTEIASELKGLGFDEVLFTDFSIPDSPEIDFSGNKVEAIQDAANTLVNNCATDRFVVSFLGTGSTVQPVSGCSRLYLTGVDAAGAAAAAAAYTVEDPAINLVFLTDSYDTRFEICSVLRPMDSAA